MFEEFEYRHIEVSETTIFARVGGSGPPLLLLHGYPQTGAMWNRVAPGLARDFTVVCTDLRGYGASGAPASDDTHLAYSKRKMANDQVEVMAALGFDMFAVAGHDRGGRVVHRMVLDHPNAVTRAAVLDIAPTRTMFEGTDMGFALTNYHWFFLAQPYDLPERMIAADPDAYLRHRLGRAGNIADVYHPDAVAEYAHAFADPQVIHASCEDYRAAATIDLDHDRADDDVRIACPFLVLWGAHGPLERHFDVLATWRDKAAGPVTGKALDCGHFLAEERPKATLTALRDFFGVQADGAPGNHQNGAKR